ncbi:hypothetical protein WOLCODRAFT_138100 [Wolfiporia cocos MD-104 SS10]|uniref:Pali-domain-containing protein n=1 Tax=Wolfiporia cocos (strain MD-104) TaxID=742152 RepID=A0A2H3JLX2_WOLCO|nr:hypothetical protein WOLCODRAFT_138100 [Wolfiporia cocos MD-104 SS10]
MGKALHIPGIILLFSSFVLLLLVSVSLPYLDVFAFVRVHVTEGSVTVGSNATAVTELKYGVWADCWYDASGDRTCSPLGYAYNTSLYSDGGKSSVDIGSSWTRGLTIHPVAAGVTLIAVLLSLSSHTACVLLAAITSGVAGTTALVAFAVDIALLAYLKGQVGRLGGAAASVDPAPGFWMTLAALVALFVAAGGMYLGRRRDRMAGATSYPMETAKA